VPNPAAKAGANAFVVSEQRRQLVSRANTIITSARAAWVKMKTTYSKSFLAPKKSLF
jgi:hypothetical protein